MWKQQNGVVKSWALEANELAFKFPAPSLINCIILGKLCNYL